MSLLTRPSTDSAAPAPSPGRRRATGTPQVARAAVNLLSPWVLEELRVRRLRRRFVVADVTLLLVVAAVWGVLRFNLADAERALHADEAVGDDMTAQIGELRDVKVYVTNVRLRARVVEKSMAHQIAFADVMRALDASLPPGTRFATISVLLPPDPATLDPGAAPDATAPGCPGPDPFGTREVVGCVAIQGIAGSRADVSTLVQSLGRSALFVEPFISGTTAETGEEGGVAFEGSVGLAPMTFTGRFADVDGSDAADRTQPGQPPQPESEPAR